MFNTVALVGATGAVGRIVLDQLLERKFPLKRLRLLASTRSVGKSVRFGDQSIRVELLDRKAFDDVDLVIASTPDDVSAEFVPWAVDAGAVVVDESAYWRMRDDVPLVVPEVNPDSVASHNGILASPNCSTTQMVVALAPLHRAAGVRRIVVSTYQATSGAGLAGEKELRSSLTSALEGKEPAAPEVFQYPIGMNLIPQIGSQKEKGYTSEELKLVYETRKIFGAPGIQVCPTCVRVPVATGHSMSVLVETDKPLTAAEARGLFIKSPGIKVLDDLDAGSYPMPIDCVGKDDVFVGRIRDDLSGNGVAFWCVSDNLRKGAATNAVQIAELLVEESGKKSDAEKRSL